MYIIVIVFALIVIAYQDFKFRAFHWIPLVVVTIISIKIGLEKTNFDELLRQLLINLIYFSFLQLIIILYFFAKTKHYVNIYNNYIGLGDILLFVPLSILFSPINLVVIFPLILIIVLCAYVLIMRLKNTNNSKDRQVPLAGFLSIILIVLFIIKVFFDFDLFHKYIL